MVGDRSGGVELVGRPSRWSRTGQEILQVVRNWSETLLEVWKWSGDPPGGQEVVWRTFQRSGIGRGTHAEDRKWAEDPH